MGVIVFSMTPAVFFLILMWLSLLSFTARILIFLYETHSKATMVTDMELNQKLVGIRIMQRRKALDLTQEQLGAKIGRSKNHLSCIERGIQMPTVEMLLDICSVLGGTPDYYLFGKLSEQGSHIDELIAQLPENSQHILEMLLETYLRAIH